MSKPHIFSFPNELIAIRGSMLYDHYLRRSAAADRKRARRLAGIKTAEDAQAYIAEIKEKLRLSFGEMPPVQPISPMVTGSIETGKLRIEKIVFQSRTGFFVTALFYCGKNVAAPVPGVLFLCGHDTNGKHHPTYQRIPQSLALRGMGVLVVDPYGQGERQEKDLECTAAHNAFGFRLGLLGEYLGAWRLHDALTALEYLKSRPETDPRRLCVTGCSGGGTLTAFTAAFAKDPLIAAPVCSMTRHHANLEGEICADNEQNPPRFRELGLDENDLLIAGAPAPRFFGVQDNDFFNPAATCAMYRELKKFYSVFGKSDHVRLALGEGVHGYPVHHQQKVGEFFSEMTGAVPIGSDDDIEIQEMSALYCTPGGRVWDLKGALTAGEMLQQLSARKIRPSLERFCKMIIPDTPRRAPAFRMGFKQYIAPRGLYGNRFQLTPEPGITITLKEVGPAPNSRLSCTPEVVAAVAQDDGLTEYPELCSTEDRKAFIIEPRGTGESRPCRMENDLNIILPGLYGSWELMFGGSIVSARSKDILSALLLLKKHGARKVILKAAGMACVPAAVAALNAPLEVEKEFSGIPHSMQQFIADWDLKIPPYFYPFGLLCCGDLDNLGLTKKS